MIQGAGDEIELDIDELDAQTLYKLYAYVSKHAPPLETKYVPPPPPPRPVAEPKAKTKTTSKPKKNKPMSAVEQEAKIKDLQARLQNFDNPTPQPSAPGKPLQSWFCINEISLIQPPSSP